MNTQQMEANVKRMPQPPRPIQHFQDRPQMARPPITTMAYQGPTPRFNPVSIGPTFTQSHPMMNPLHETLSTSYYMDPHMRRSTTTNISISKSTTNSILAATSYSSDSIVR